MSSYLILEIVLILTSSLIIGSLLCHKQDESVTRLLTDEEIEAERALKPFKAAGTHPFSELIEDKAFVDKTLFIKDFFEFPSRHLYLTAARKFGKSINLDMLHHFFDAQVFENGSIQERESTDSYKMFEKTMLFRKENAFFKEHAQQYKVLRLNFSPLSNVTDEKSFKSQLSRVICDAKEDHRSLQNLGSTLYRYPNFQMCVENLEKKSTVALLSGGEFLSSELFKFYKKKVIVLADEFDAILHMVVRRVNVTPDLFCKLVDRFFGFVDPLTKGNENVRKGIFVGTLTLAGGISALANNIDHFYSHSRPQLGKYFGFTQQEVNQLLKRFQISGVANKVKLYYDGYSIEGLPDVSIYSPLSLISFLSTQQFKNFWTAGLAQSTLLSTLFSHPHTGESIQRILSETSYYYKFQTGRPNWELIGSVRKSVMSKNVESMRAIDEMLVIQFVFENGYLTRDKNKPYHAGDDAIYLKATNLEIKQYLTETLFDSDFLKNQLKLTMNEMVRFGSAIKNVLPNNTESIKELAKAIHLMFIHICPGSDERTDFHGLLYGVLINSDVRRVLGTFLVHTEAKINLPTQEEIDLKAEIESGAKSEVKKEDEKDEAHADLVVIINGIGLVMELERHRTSECGLRQILTDHHYDVFEQKFAKHKLRSKIYMGINIARNGTVTISFLCDNIHEEKAKKVQYPEEAKNK